MTAGWLKSLYLATSRELARTPAIISTRRPDNSHRVSGKHDLSTASTATNDGLPNKSRWRVPGAKPPDRLFA